MNSNTHCKLNNKDQLDDFGERPLRSAPHVVLKNNSQAVPQQFFEVSRNIDNIEAIISNIDFHPNYPLFVSEKNGIPYLQVGIIGVENYAVSEAQRQQAKIVYGRMWLIEPHTPTSEVVQTALLAIKKAREHEIREKFIIRINEDSHVTPCSNHIDLPLMVENMDVISLCDKQQQNVGISDINHTFDCAKFNTLSIDLISTEKRDNKQTIVEYTFTENPIHSEDLFPEYVGAKRTLVLDSTSPNEILHKLLDDILTISDMFVDDNFTFKGKARFSRKLSLFDIGQFSLSTRKVKIDDDFFKMQFKKMTTHVDSSRVPSMASGKLGDKQRHSLSLAPVIDGYLPKSQLKN